MDKFEPAIIMQTILNFLKFLWQSWKKFPEQVKRLSVIFAALIAMLVAARGLLIPSDFGQYGHYRASAVEEIASQEIQYAGREICYDCHDDIVEIKSAGFHKNVGCEVCHGPAAAHTEDIESIKLLAPRGRGGCPVCHEYLPSRPTGFPQIISASHNPVKSCITCHEPHDPKPPETPKECSACHATIARTKAISHHAYVDCTRCHEGSEGHKDKPRTIIPSIPANRAFCGGCHADQASREGGVPQIDLATHEASYVCWQCHYPHLPEAQ